MAAEAGGQYQDHDDCDGHLWPWFLDYRCATSGVTVGVALIER
jgi:hypothetical protein